MKGDRALEIILSDVYGFCGGVKRAVDLAFTTARENSNVKMMGELVHNADVNRELKDL
ncbi:hypothetical protein, partial [Aedoeadaptatus coxii]